MAPKKESIKKTGSIIAADVAQETPEVDPNKGTGKFFYPTGATYEGDWMLMPEQSTSNQAVVEASKGKPDPKAAPPPSTKGAPTPPTSDAPTPALDRPRPNRQRHGKGLYMDGGYQYEGEWQNDKMHGQGCFKYASGAYYTGQWEENAYMGVGVYKWPNGASYAGGWRDNKMHGDGTYTDKEGNIWGGQFFNGTGPGLICEIK